MEPDWYGDEGVYQVVGQAIDQGRMLYTQIWDNKPPLLYILYALFGGDQFFVRTISLIFSIASTIAIFLLSRLLFKRLKARVITTALFAFLFATPILEGNVANAENFMLLPIIIAALLIYKSTTSNLPNHKIKLISYLILNTKYFILLMAGLLLGLAFLFKIVAIFDFAAFFVFFLIVNLPQKLSSFNLYKNYSKESRIKYHGSWFLSLIPNLLFLILGFILPILLTITYFFFHNTLRVFIQATFFGNIGYVGYANKFIIPQGLLITKLVLLGGFTLFLMVKRKQFSTSTLFIMIWLAFSLFNAFFSQRPYTHYLLVLLPSFCLLCGLIFQYRQPFVKLTAGIISLIIIILVAVSFGLKWSIVSKPFLYYYNSLRFITGNMSVHDYQSSFDRKTPRDYEIATFITKHTTPKDSIFIWGDNPQIYALAHRLPTGRYTVAYHITQNEGSYKETQAALNRLQPKYIVVLTEAPLIPFHLPGYSGSIMLKGATIYEKIL